MAQGLESNLVESVRGSRHEPLRKQDWQNVEYVGTSSEQIKTIEEECGGEFLLRA